MQPKFGIFLTPSPKILDVFDRFFGRKNVRLGVNGNAGNWQPYTKMSRDKKWSNTSNTGNAKHKMHPWCNLLQFF